MKPTLEGFKEIADFFGVREKTVREWAEHYKLPVDMIRGTALAEREELARWKRENRIPYPDHIRAVRERRAAKAVAA